MSVSISAGSTSNWSSGPCESWVLLWSTLGVWLVVDGSSLVSVDSGSTVSLVVSNSSSVWAVDWNLLIVDTESISVSIWIREKSSLEHLISGWLNSWNKMAWVESRLLNFGVIVFWVSIQSHLTNFLERIISL